jgi:hypothetical protein
MLHASLVAYRSEAATKNKKLKQQLELVAGSL